jgi:hypothetical protein
MNLSRWIFWMVFAAILPLSVTGNFSPPNACAACSDRPGTPDNLKLAAVRSNPTSMSLEWRNNASEGWRSFFEREILGYPGELGGALGIPGSHEIIPKAAGIYFDISVREGSPDGKTVGLDRTGIGPYTTNPPSISNTRPVSYNFDNLKPSTLYCFRVRARTEAGTQGCVSQLWSNWECGWTHAVAPAPPKSQENIPIPSHSESQSPGTVSPGRVLQRAPAGPTPLPQNPRSPSEPILSQRPSAVLPTTKASVCKSGYVWRAARPEDLVCVMPESRTRIAEENRTAVQRVQPGAAPNCRSGYVWREAFNGDLVCVTPQVRALVREENQLGTSRRIQQ